MITKCYEVDPFSFSDQFKSTLKIINPFQRIHKEINDLFLNLRAVDEIYRKDYENELFNSEKFEKLVEDYYDYKIQYKKYGLTFYIEEKKENEGIENNKEVFINET